MKALLTTSIFVLSWLAFSIISYHFEIRDAKHYLGSGLGMAIVFWIATGIIHAILNNEDEEDEK